MHLPHATRAQALVAAVLLLVGLAVTGRSLARGSPAAEPAARAVAVTPSRAPRVLVHVVGAVRRPGLYRLGEDSRTADAVSRAGGPTRRADLAQINLAAPVVDGAQVVVPRREATAAPAGSGAAAPAPAAVPGPVHLNTATAEQLDGLPGVGPVTAEKIVAFRKEHGAFASVDELDAVPGIGPARLEELRKAAAP